MKSDVITTEGAYAKGVIIPRVKPAGARRAIVTFLPARVSAPARTDEEIWQEMEPAARKIRKGLFRATYPARYAKPKKSAA